MTMLFRLTAYSIDEDILEILRSEPRFPSKNKMQSSKRLSLRPARWWAMLAHCNFAR